MAKSSYLENLINNKLPKNVYESRYLSELWDSITDAPYTTYRNSLVNSFSEEVAVAVAGSDYLNNLRTNQTVLDMRDPVLQSVTLNPQYLPITEKTFIDKNFNSKISQAIKAPPGYLPARITSIKGGTYGKMIPILFPKSFSRSISASFAKENPVGSVTPIMAYSYTDAEEIPIEFDAIVDYLPDGYTTLSSYVDEVINILKPRINGSVVYEPTVLVEFADIRFKGICTSINISYDNLYTGASEKSSSFVHAVISCQFTKLNK